MKNHLPNSTFTQILVGLFFLLFCFSLNAKTVEPQNAASVAQFLLEQRFDAQLRTAPLTLAHTEQNQNSVAYYVFNVGDRQGFIIISGDDVARPILGYTTQGAYAHENRPPNFAAWMNSVAQAIQYGVNANIAATAPIQEEWGAYMNRDENYFVRTRANVVEPLIKTAWSQSPYYNALCPTGTPTGCVATAMAQIMKFYTYPAQGTGSHSYLCKFDFCDNYDYGTLTANFGTTTYDWSLMPNSISAANAQIATLMYHCGVSVDMMYCPGGSGAYSINIGDAITNHFGYDKALRYETREYFTDDQWIALLKEELDAGKPIYYAGESSSGGGHALICDGYDDQDRFHFNWGWGGSSDGFYAIDLLAYHFDNEIYTGWKPEDGGSPVYQMYLFQGTDLTVTKTSVKPGETLQATAQFINAGWIDFPGGKYSIGLFDDSDNLEAVIGTYSGTYSMTVGTYYSPFTINCTVPTNIAPGNYTLKAITQPNTRAAEWTVARGTGVWEIPFTVRATPAFFENFENKISGDGAYTGATVTFASGSWSIYGFTTMTSGSDRFNGARSVRLRGNNTDTGNNLNKLEMLFDKPNGIGTVSFAYASFSTHSGGIVNLQYSTDQGATWENAGSVTVPAWNAGTGMLTKDFEINITGNARIRITKDSQTGNTSVNIDDIEITDFFSTDPTITVEPLALPFGNVEYGKTSAPQTLTVTGLNLTDEIEWELTGTDETAFEVDATQWSSGILSVTFKPTEIKDYEAEINLTSIGAGSVTVPLTGKGSLHLIAKWNGYPLKAVSPTYTYIANGGLPANNGIAPLDRDAAGAAFEVFADGVPTSTGWDNATTIEKYWITQFSTVGYANLIFTSKQRSPNTGPRDFKVQYRVGVSGVWTDVANSTVVVANDAYLTGVLEDIPLPAALNNEPEVYLRWLCTSTVSANGGTVAAGGNNR
ncbi:MAG: C10 family peptidase, partial [Bacteroidales bacterium]|nr:C10 family peptidase [Bacteroidales bacterium]